MADSETLVIKRYPNRRLYDTSAGRYVNLGDVAAAVRQGIDVKVVDTRTGEDLTRVVLTQIIVEDAKDQPTGLPLELLRQLVVSSDQAGREFLMWYLKSAFDAYRKVQETVQVRLGEVRSAAFTPLNLMKNLLTGPPTPIADDELAQLRQRVAELEATLKKPKAPKRKKASNERKR